MFSIISSCLFPSELWSGGDDTFKTAAQNGPHLKVRAEPQPGSHCELKNIFADFCFCVFQNSDPLMEASCTQTSRPVQDSKLLQHRQVNMDMELLRYQLKCWLQAAAVSLWFLRFM